MQLSLLFLFILIWTSNSKIGDICINSEENCINYSKENFELLQNKKNKKETFTKEHEQPSFYSFLKNAYINFFFSENSEFYKYIDGITYIFQTIKKVYQQAQKENINFDNYINENITLHNPEQKDDNYEKKTPFLRSLYPYYLMNNSDTYEYSDCSTEPNIKAQYYTYICNEYEVNKTIYEMLKNNENFLCEMYNNTVKLCFCPITTRYCRGTMKIYCDINDLTVNSNKYNLTKNRNTFYSEYFNEISLPLSEQNFTFNISIRCGTPEVPPEFKGKNFYVSCPPDGDFEVLSIEYKDDYKGEKKQYTREQLKEGKEKVLDYYIYDDTIIAYQNVTLQLSFTIYDLLWVLPKYQKVFEISEELTKKFLEGEGNFQFTVDIKELLKQEPIEEVLKNVTKYKQMDKGDLLFYEIRLRDIEDDNVDFFSFRGDINTLI